MVYNFNISYSAINLLKGCERSFYYSYIAKLLPEETIRCYGNAGTVVHDTIQNCHNKSIEETKKFFDNKWGSYNLSTTNKDPFGRLMQKEKYWDSVVRAKKIKYNILRFEELLKFQSKHLIKGYADAIVQFKDGIGIIDWKTSSSINPNMVNQLKFYCYLYYKKYRVIPKRGVLEFLKIGKKIEYEYSMQDVKDIQKMLDDFIKNIYSKKSFEDWKPSQEGLESDMTRGACFFCPHKNKCRKYEMGKMKGIDEEKFTIVINKNSKIKFGEPHTKKFVNTVDKLLSYQAVDENTLNIMKRNPKVIAKKPSIVTWDGRKHLKKYGSYPIGVLDRLKKFIVQYSQATGVLCPIEIIDQRKKIINVIELPKNPNAHELRWYQEEAVEMALRKKMGILDMFMASGKTLLASEIYRRNPINTLFVVDRKVLLTQTIKEFSEQLGIPIEEFSTITDGEIILGKRNIAFATIQTVAKRIKEKNVEMIEFLKNIHQIISDECHMNKANGYKLLFGSSVNAQYRFGLTGTPEEDNENFLELVANMGDIIYRVSSEQLIKEGLIIKPKITFMKYEHGEILEGSFNDFKEQLFQNPIRNKKIIDIIKKHNGDVQLILVDRITHGDFLKQYLEHEGFEVFFIQGKVSQNQREKILQDARNHHTRILIGTGSIVSKGLNIKPLKVVINATGNATSVQTIQSLGRVLRKDDGKEGAYFYDFYDTVRYFWEHTQARIKAFEKLGNEILYTE